MFEWIRKLRHTCPTKDQMKKLIEENIILLDELTYEARRRSLAERTLKLEMDEKLKGFDNNYV
jgi:hypothetical protein